MRKSGAALPSAKAWPRCTSTDCIDTPRKGGAASSHALDGDTYRLILTFVPGFGTLRVWAPSTTCLRHKIGERGMLCTGKSQSQFGAPPQHVVSVLRPFFPHQ